MSIALPQPESPVSKKPRRMPPSQKRLEANRRNARRSTGPRTPEGKKRSAANGRLAHATVCSVDASVTTENDATFFLHVQDMHRIFKPHTVLQQQLFPQLCALQWTLDRMIEAEAKIYRKLAKTPDEPPCEILARVFVEHPTRNPLVAFERYWRRRQSEYWRLVKEYDRISQRPDTVDPAESQQWEAARRLQAERARKTHGAQMEQLVEKARREVVRLSGGEPTSGEGVGDNGPESPVEGGGEAENANPLLEEDSHVGEAPFISIGEEKAILGVAKGAEAPHYPAIRPHWFFGRGRD